MSSDKIKRLKGKNVEKINFAERSSIEFVEEGNILSTKI